MTNNDELLMQKQTRAIKLIRFYNKDFNESSFEMLLQKPTLNLFLTCVGRMPDNYIEEVDSQTFDKLFYEILELKK